MSIIIRLQNLPWSANAEDIRQFFGNLIIPDGGVHIVGGEHGDAFIVFGSDEDARQAMMKDGGQIKDVKVKLLLSSRVEMQKVIDVARQQALSSQIQTLAATRFDPSSLQIPAMLPHMLSALPTLRLPGSATLTSMPMPAMPAMPTPSPMNFQVPVIMPESKPEDLKPGLVPMSKHPIDRNRGDKSDEKLHSRSRSRSQSNSRSKSRSRSRSRDKKGYRDRYGRYQNKSRDRYRYRDRSRSKERDKNGSRSHSRDRYRKRSRSRDRKNRDKEYNNYKSKDKRKDYDKNKCDDAKEKSPTKSEKPLQKKFDQDSRFKPIPEVQQKDNSRSTENHNSGVIAEDSKSLFKMTFGTLHKQSSWSTEQKQNTPNENTAKSEENINESRDYPTETKNGEKNMNWFGNIISPSMIPPWMMPQITEPAATTVNTTETQVPVTTSTEQKTEIPSMPFGMCPFNQAFPAPPAGIHPFGNYSTTANFAIQPPMPANFPMSLMPTNMFNQFQATPPSMVGNSEMVQRSAEMKRNESREIADEVDSFGRDRKRYKEQDSHSPDQNAKNYENGNFYERRDGYKPRSEYMYENKHYANSRNSFDDEDSRGSRNNQEEYTRKNAYRRNYDKHDSSDDRRDNYSRLNYEDTRKMSSYNSSFSTNTSIEMSNIPLSATENDIKKFFTPLHLYDSCIKFQSNDKRSRVRNAFIKFGNVNQKTQALKYSGQSMNGFRIQLVEIEDHVWEAAENLNVYVEEPYLKISFIPRRAGEKDIASAFPQPPEDIVIKKVRDRESLEAYLKFAEKQPIIEALKNKDKILISEGRVKLEAVRKEIYLLAKNETDNEFEGETNNEPNEHDFKLQSSKRSRTYYTDNELEPEEEALLNAQSMVEEYEPQSQMIKSNCLLLQNLPFNSTDKEIVNFFSDLKVSPLTVHIMYNTEGRSTGESFCEFENETDAEIALQKDRSLLNDRLISVSVVSKEDVQKAISAPSAPSRYGGSRSGPSLYNNVGYGRPRAPFGSRPPGPRSPFNRAPVMPRRPTGVERFGKPGCVVSLENVPYKADVDDILEFFTGFEVTKENVIRRFNENGLATGDARVCLQTPNEAMTAARDLDGKKINDRSIYVRVVP